MSPGISYGELGPTHHSCEDLAILRTLPNINILAPADEVELRQAMREAIKLKSPTYIRIGKKGEEIIEKKDDSFSIGRSITVREGKDVCLIGTGTILPEILKGADIISSKNISSKGEIPKNNMCAFFVNYLLEQGVYKEEILEYEFGNLMKLSSEDKHEDSSKIIPSVNEVLNPKNIKIAQREALMWGTHQQESIEYGNVIHEILSFVNTKNDVDLAITKALENGLIQLGQKEAVYQTILEIVNLESLINHFAEGNRVLNEQTIIQKEGKIMKPDRMVVTPDQKVYLLDYKTGVANSKYIEQLNDYQHAIEEIGYEVIEKVIVYIGAEVEVHLL
jgi:hypothetical protein